MTTARPFFAALLAAGFAAMLGGCSVLSFPPQTRGNKIDPEMLSQLVPGTSSRADATSLLGSPTARATFDDNTWIYISEVTTPVIGGRNKVHEQDVVTLNFDQNGVLRTIQKKNQDDSAPVTMTAGATPSPGSSANILQELLGNVGRFSAAPTGAAAANANGIGGAPVGGGF